jgi:hypothetical protein
VITRHNVAAVSLLMVQWFGKWEVTDWRVGFGRVGKEEASRTKGIC